MEDYGLDALGELGDEIFAPLRARDARGDPRGARRHLPLRASRPTASSVPFDFKIALTVAGDEIVADFAGTSPQQPRAINCVLAYTYAMTAYAVRCALLPGLPNNEGMYRPIKVEAPEGSLLNPRFPAAVVSRAHDRPLRADPGAGRAAPGDPRARDGGGGLAAVGAEPSRRARRRQALHHRALLQRRHGRHRRSRTASTCCRGRATSRPRRSRWPSATARSSSTTSACAPAPAARGRYPRRARPGHPDREPSRRGPSC